MKFVKASQRAVAVLSVVVVVSQFSVAQQDNDQLAAVIRPVEPSASGAAAPYAPNVKPTITLQRVTGAISVDGELDDPGWLDAAEALNFTEFNPNEGALPPVEISAWSTYDDSFLYVAVRIEDDPSAIRANLSGRDKMFGDDFAGVILDTEGDGQALYLLATNPLGIQGDSRISYNGEDDSFDLIYSSEARITDSGYQIEMAIPFRSLRFPKANQQHWRVTYFVNHPRDSRSQYTWAKLDRDNSCIPCQLGYLEGIQDVSSGRNLEILPSLVGGQSGALRNADNAAEGFDNARLNLEPSLDLKYGITSNLTAEATLNPDFSQIESDAAQIDVNSTFALSFPERRPFFQEGGDLFGTFIQTMYTRSINDPIYAGKVTGKLGSTDVALLTARDYSTPLLLPFEEKSELVDAGRSLSNIARVRHAFSDNSYLGGMLTDRHIDGGGSGTTVGLDGMYRLGQKYMLEGQFVLSRTTEVNDLERSADFEDEMFDAGQHTGALDGEHFGGHALHAGFGRDARHWMFRTSYNQISPTFRADNGFVTQNSMRRFTAWQGLAIYPKEIKFIETIRPSVALWRQWNFENMIKSDGLNAQLSVNMKAQTQVFFFGTTNGEMFAGQDFSGLYTMGAGIASNFSKYFDIFAIAHTGTGIRRDIDNPEVGNSLNVELRASFRPTEKFVVSPQFTYAQLRHRETGESYFAGYVARSTVNYQFSRRLTLRTVVQYNDFSESLEVDPLITYRINPFTVFHVGSTHDMQYVDTTQRDIDQIFRQTNRQFFFKFQYLVRA